MTLQELQENVSTGLHIVKFSATWCSPCKMLENSIKNAMLDIQSKVEIISIDVDENPEITAHFGVMGVPRMIVFKDGEIVDDVSGFQSKPAIVDLVFRHA